VKMTRLPLLFPREVPEGGWAIRTPQTDRTWLEMGHYVTPTGCYCQYQLCAFVRRW
jgi:hypothetical protein